MGKSGLAVATVIVLLMACGPRGAPEAPPATGPAAAAPAGAQAAAPPAAPPASAAASAPPAAAASAPPAPATVKYAFAPRLPMVPVYIAQEKGYFAEQALDVDFVPFLAGSNEMLVPMSRGELDVAAAGLGSGMVNAAADGVMFRMVADQGQIGHGRSVYNVVVRSDVADKIKTVDDLRGTTGGVAAITAGLSLPYTFFKIAQAAGLTTPDGLDFANFTFVETPEGGEFVEHKEDPMPAVLPMQLFRQAPADLIEQQADERLGPADVGRGHHNVECRWPVAGDQVDDAPVAAAGHPRHHRIAVEAQE